MSSQTCLKLAGLPDGFVQSMSPGEELVLSLEGLKHAYGHGFRHTQPYPLTETVQARFAVNNIQAPIWLFTDGDRQHYALLAQTLDMLSVALYEGGQATLCLSGPTGFTLGVFAGETLTQAHQGLLSALGERRLQPAPAFVGDGLFCTWTEFPRCITQERMLAFAKAIRQQGYPCSALVLDDRWERAYGDFAFSADFPAPRGMADGLHALGFEVILWTTPFINVDSQNHRLLGEKGLLVQDEKGRPALFTWWGGEAGLIDITHPQGEAWLEGQLRHLMAAYGIDGFKIDGGDAKYQPQGDVVWHAYAGASGYSDKLLAIYERVAPGRCETRTAWLSQGRNIVWRQGGKDSHWGLDNGLGAVVTLGLHMSLMGYDFFIPDMVPGRVQTMNAQDPLPTDEYFVRFTECAAWMPGLQFSYGPWHYAQEVNGAALIYARLHKALGPYVGECLASGQPVLRPIWYGNEICPHREALLTAADQFMLGPDVVAAPCLVPGMTARDMVLPQGNWVNVHTGEVLVGGLHRGIEAPSPGMPAFIRQENAPLLKAAREVLAGLKRGSVPTGRTSATYQAGVNRHIDVTG